MAGALGAGLAVWAFGGDQWGGCQCDFEGAGKPALSGPLAVAVPSVAYSAELVGSLVVDALVLSSDCQWVVFALVCDLAAGCGGAAPVWEAAGCDGIVGRW